LLSYLFQEKKGDIIFKYSTEESKYLKTYGEIPDNIQIDEISPFNYQNKSVNEFFENRF